MASRKKIEQVLRERLLREMKGLSFQDAWKLRTRLISEHTFDNFKFKVKVKPEVKGQLRSTYLASSDGLS